jgi:hypothetical protein
MGKQGWLPVAESCRRITIQDISRKGELLDGCGWIGRITGPSGFTVEAECRLEPLNCRRLCEVHLDADQCSTCLPE